VKRGFGRVIRAVLVLLVLLVLFIIGWISYVSHLTAREDRACRMGISAINESIGAGDDGELQRVLDSYSARNGGVGLQATVIFSDGATWSGASGYASREKRCPLTLDHYLYIGSITKLYTAMLVMDEVEEGAISLDDALDKWIDLPYADTVTVKMLLNHTSGIPSYTEDIWFLVRYFGLAEKRWEADKLVKETIMSDSILVAYATRYGSTQEVAEAVAATMRDSGLEVDLQPMRQVRTLEGYRAVVLGAPLYIGRWHKDAQRFLSLHQETLTQRPVAIFTLGPTRPDEKEWEGVHAQLDQELAKVPWLTPIAVELFGGKYDPAKLSFFHKLLATLPASPLHQMPASDVRDWTAIRAWASDLAAKL